jgi:hypothetical protein
MNAILIFDFSVLRSIIILPRCFLGAHFAIFLSGIKGSFFDKSQISAYRVWSTGTSIQIGCCFDFFLMPHIIKTDKNHEIKTTATLGQ